MNRNFLYSLKRAWHCNAMRLLGVLFLFFSLNTLIATEKCYFALLDFESALTRISQEGLADWSYPDTLVPSMSSQMRQFLINEAALLYARSSKDHIQKPLLAPKRALAALIHSLSGTHLKLAQQLEAGVNPLLAYNRYLKSIEKIYAPYLDTRPYSAELVADIAALIVRNSEFSKIEIFGSLPNGRANFSSFDVDIYAQAPTIFFEDMRARIVGGQEISKKIEAYFKSLDIPLKEQGLSLTGVVSLDQMTRARPYFSYLFQAGVLSSPVTVFANKREIRIRIYPRPWAKGQAPREFFLRRL